MDKTNSQQVIVLAPNGGATLAFMGMKIAFKTSGKEWALIETTLPPHFSGIPLHWHEATHQSFYVLEGKVTFQVGERIFLVEPGAFVSVPAGVLHTFRNENNHSARLLEIIVPSGLENVFKELVAMNTSEPALILKPHKMLDLYKRYDTFMPKELT